MTMLRQLTYMYIAIIKIREYYVRNYVRCMTVQEIDSPTCTYVSDDLLVVNMFCYVHWSILLKVILEQVNMHMQASLCQNT